MSPAVEASRLTARAGASCTGREATHQRRRGECPTLAAVRRAARMERRARIIAARPNHHSTQEVPA